MVRIEWKSIQNMNAIFCRSLGRLALGENELMNFASTLYWQTKCEKGNTKTVHGHSRRADNFEIQS